MRNRFSFAVWGLALVSGCGQDLDVGSDLWTSRFEFGGNSFPEWTNFPFGHGGAGPVPSPNTPNQPNTIEVSSEQAHHGTFAAKLTISATAGNTAGLGASLVQNGGLPSQAYYSAWYYLPQSVTVGVYWVIMKFRAELGDPPSEGELFDVNLTSPPTGGCLCGCTTIEMGTCSWMCLSPPRSRSEPGFNSRLFIETPTTPQAA